MSRNQDSPLEELEFIHLSDLHIRSYPDAGGPFLRGLSKVAIAGRKVEALVRHICRYHPEAHVIITGDITDSGNRGEYEEAVRILESLRSAGRLSLVPGNHDVRRYGIGLSEPNLSGFQHAFEDLFQGDVEYPWVKYLDHVAVIGLDSSAATKKTSIAMGRLGDDQLSRLRRILSRAAVRQRVPLHPATSPPMAQSQDTEAEGPASIPRDRRGVQRIFQAGDSLRT